MKDHLRDLVNQLLSDDRGIALGHALELAHTLHLGPMPRESERCARRVLEIVDSIEGGHKQGYQDSAFTLLAAALLEQGLWKEVDALKGTVAGDVQSLVITNLRAVALMELGRLEESRALLDEVMQRAPTDAMALTNYTALLVRLQDWQGTLEAARRAVQQVGPEHRDIIWGNEVIARRHLGDSYGAEQALNGISPEKRARFDLEPATSGTPVVFDKKDLLPATGDGGVPPAELISLATSEQRVDIAIVTVLPEEYDAVRSLLANVQRAPERPGFVNLFGWVVGTLRRSSGETIRVGLALVAQPGNVPASMATLRTIDRWGPRYLIFSGVAGGLNKDGLVEGDIILSTFIWHYEYGKIDAGFTPRHRYTFRPDSGLYASAVAYNAESNDWRNCGVAAPRNGHTPKLLTGAIASGEKVIDDLTNDFVETVLRACPELRAVEMEGAGACAAIELARAEGQNVAFLMVRGISDMPRAMEMTPEASEGGQTAQRDNWKPFAAAAAAKFIASWIMSPWGPRLAP